MKYVVIAAAVTLAAAVVWRHVVTCERVTVDGLTWIACVLR